VTEHDAEQRVRQYLNDMGYTNRGELIPADVREVLRQLDEARSELARRILQRDNAHKARITAEQERDEARFTARHYRDAYHREDPLAELSLGLLPDWLTAEPQQQPPT
jgi:hypothetical protein